MTVIVTIHSTRSSHQTHTHSHYHLRVPLDLHVIYCHYCIIYH